jgi:hypothetical protein
MPVLRITQPRVAVALQQPENLVADLPRVGHPSQLSLVAALERVLAAPLLGTAARAAGRLHDQVGQAQQTLDGALVDLEVLDVGKRERGLVDQQRPLPDAEAPIGDHVVPHVVVNPDEKVLDHGAYYRSHQHEIDRHQLEPFRVLVPVPEDEQEELEENTDGKSRSPHDDLVRQEFRRGLKDLHRLL